MPDRLPPHWGHEPEDGRDLDALPSVEEILTDEALLAGQLAGISESQRPVAGAMFALRAAPAGSELAGEAAARAVFRTELHHTLALPVPAEGQGPRPPARHRHRRRAAGRRGWHVVALVSSAAAVVAIGAALVGTIGSAGHRGPTANPSSSQLSTQPGASPAVRGVMGHATRDATPSATPKPSATPGAIASPDTASRGIALCREYFSFRHVVDGAKRKEIFQQLSQLAGTREFWGVVDYCDDQDTHLFTMPPNPTSDGKWRFPGSGAKDSPASGARTDQPRSGKASSGPGDGVSGSTGAGSGGSQ